MSIPLILIIVLALAVLVAAFLASKVWHWAHVLVMVGLAFATIGFAFLSAKALDIRSKYQQQAVRAEAQLEEQQEMQTALRKGTDNAGMIARLRTEESPLAEDAESMRGLTELRHQLRLASATVGRVWRDVQPQGMDAQSMRIVLSVPAPQPPGIAPGSLLFAFEQGQPNVANPDQGAQYLGEFRVVDASGQNITLEPVLKMSDREMQRLSRASGAWVLYENMPADTHEMFAEFSDEELRQLMPAESVEEYLRDGTAWTVDDGEWVKQPVNEDGLPWAPEITNAEGEVVATDDGPEPAGYIYRRQLRDYAFLFGEHAKDRIQLIAQRQALEADIAKLKATLASIEAIGQQLAATQADLKHDKQGVMRDAKAIADHVASLNRQIAKGERLLEMTLARNEELADRLAAMHREILGSPARGALDRDAL